MQKINLKEKLVEKEISEQEMDLLYDMNDVIKIIKSIDDSGVSIDGVTETVKHKIKKQEGGLLGDLVAPLAASLLQLVISSVVKGISGSGVRRAEREYVNKNF